MDSELIKMVRDELELRRETEGPHKPITQKEVREMENILRRFPEMIKRFSALELETTLRILTGEDA